MTVPENTHNLDHYKNLINKFNKLNITTKELTLFDVGTRGHFENPTTELLSFFLDSAKTHGLGDCFFNGLQAVITDKVERLTFGSLQDIATEVLTAKGNRIDLLLETDSELIIVECKIYHEQNNPFDDYTNYANQRKKNRQVVKLVLCLDGKIDKELIAKDWHGISYNELVQSIELNLSKALLDNPYNKWGLFAREFLLHLKELNKMGDINKDEIQFLTENFKAFTELSAYIYENLMPKIGEKIEKDLSSSNLDNFDFKEKSGKWNSYEPIRRFSNANWTTQSDITLWIKASKKSTSCQIRIYIDKQSNELVNKFKSLLSEQFLNREKREWYELSSIYWGISWEFDDFDIEEVSKIIIELMGFLNELELDYRPSILE